jgi:hypothetical protein
MMNAERGRLLLAEDAQVIECSWHDPDQFALRLRRCADQDRHRQQGGRAALTRPAPAPLPVPPASLAPVPQCRVRAGLPGRAI